LSATVTFAVMSTVPGTVDSVPVPQARVSMTVEATFEVTVNGALVPVVQLWPFLVVAVRMTVSVTPVAVGGRATSSEALAFLSCVSMSP
jgi:hypothetical protein